MKTSHLFPVLVLFSLSFPAFADTAAWSDIDQIFQKESAKILTVGVLAERDLVGQCYTSTTAQPQNARLSFPLLTDDPGPAWLPMFKTDSSGQVMGQSSTKFSDKSMKFGGFSIAGILAKDDTIYLKIVGILDPATQHPESVSYCEF